jgi:Flp pilus assembly secretin CpaC
MRRLLILLPILLVFASLSARAEDRLDVNWRQARVVRLAKPATSIIVGDPTVADVTLDDPTTLVIFGKAPGETNLVVLSSSQEMLFDWPVVVSPETGRHVTVLDASAEPAPVEVLYSCGEQRCTRVLSPSDIAFSASSRTSTSSSSSSSASKSAGGNAAAGSGGSQTQDATPTDTNPPADDSN